VEQWIQGQNFDLLIASHDGYQRLPSPVMHRRWVVSLKNGMYLVRDVVEGYGTHRLDLSWHLAQELHLVEDGLYRVKGASQGLVLLPCKGHGWAEEVRRESWSPAYGQKAPMTVLNFSVTATLPAEFVTLLVTLEEAHPAARLFARMENASRTSDQNGKHMARGYKYVAEGVEHSFVFGSGGGVSGESWQADSLTSDAEFVYGKRKPGRDTSQLMVEGQESGLQSDGHLIFCNGSFVEASDGVALRSTRPVQWAELIIDGGVRNLFSSDTAAVAESTESALQPDPATPAPGIESI
jgi:hypothetical protein